MVWTWQTALFFAAIFALLATMTVLAIRYPETPRVGVLRIETTRGDRLFISLLGSAFLNLAWLGLSFLAGPSFAGIDEAKAFLDKEIGDLSTLTPVGREHL